MGLKYVGMNRGPIKGPVVQNARTNNSVPCYRDKKEMEDELDDVVPCTSLAVESTLRVGTVTSFIVVFVLINQLKHRLKL